MSRERFRLTMWCANTTEGFPPYETRHRSFRKAVGEARRVRNLLVELGLAQKPTWGAHVDGPGLWPNGRQL